MDVRSVGGTSSIFRSKQCTLIVTCLLHLKTRRGTQTCTLTRKHSSVQDIFLIRLIFTSQFDGVYFYFSSMTTWVRASAVSSSVCVCEVSFCVCTLTTPGFTLVYSGKGFFPFKPFFLFKLEWICVKLRSILFLMGQIQKIWSSCFESCFVICFQTSVPLRGQRTQ